MTKEPWFRWWLFILAVKLVVATWVPLSPDEAYYWIWGQNLQLSYYDHPPLVAWLFRLGDTLNWSGYSVRWPFVLLGHGAVLIGYQILTKLSATRQQKMWWLWLASLAPFIGLSSQVGTPDVPLIFFWALGVLTFISFTENSKSWVLAIALGVVLGLGLLSKYHMVLFVLCALLFLFVKRIHFSWRGFFIVFIVSSLTFSPVLIWNYQNEWASFSFQLNHGLGEKTWDPRWTLDYIFGQTAFLFPPFLYVFLRQQKQAPSLLKFFFWPVMLFFLFTSTKGSVEPNWPATAYFSFFLGVCLLSTANWMRRTYYVLFSGLIFFTLVVAGSGAPKWAHEKLLEPRKVVQLARVTSQFSPLYADSYQHASVLSFEQKRLVPKLYQMSRVDFFDTLTKGPPNEDFFLVADKDNHLPAWLENSEFKVEYRLDLDADFVLYRIQR